MQTYTIHIETVERYTITVDAKDQDAAEEAAWRLFPHYTPDHIENNVVEVVCNEQPPV